MAMLASIEGCIGVGKSTVKAALRRLVVDDPLLATRVRFVDEPVDAWERAGRHVEERGMLELFYGDPPRWALTFQLLAHATRLSALKEAREAHPGAILVSERSLAADEHTFAKMLADSGDMTPAEHRVYRICTTATNACDYAPDVVFHLTAPADTAMGRIAVRERAGEAMVTSEYNERLARYTAAWLGTLDRESVIHLDVGARGGAAILETAKAMHAELRKRAVADISMAECLWCPHLDCTETCEPFDSPEELATHQAHDHEHDITTPLNAPDCPFVHERDAQEAPESARAADGPNVSDVVDVVEATATGC